MLLLSSFQTAKNNWSDVEKLGEQYYLMFDFMINHISAHSDYYLDLIYKRKDKAPWAVSYTHLTLPTTPYV